MSSPCWSLPLPVHHNTTHHPRSTTVSKTTLYTEHLFQKTVRSTSSAKDSLSHVNYESGGNPRNTSPTGFEPKELATRELTTISGSSLEGIYQLYDGQGEFGEQDQQAPIIEEVKESGRDSDLEDGE